MTGTETGPSKEKGHARVGDSLILTKPIGTGAIQPHQLGVHQQNQ